MIWVPRKSIIVPRRKQGGWMGFYAAGAMGSGGIGPWTPGNLSPFAWWNDDSSVTASSGRAMAWQNIGTTGYPMEANVVENAPTINAAGLNGRRTLSFASSWLRNNDSGTMRSIFQNQSAGWAFAVVRRRNVDGSPTARHLFAISTALGDGGGSRFVASLGHGAANTPALLARRLDGDSTGVLNGVTSIGTSWAMILWRMDWANGDGFLHLNGDLNASNTSLTSSGNTDTLQSARAAVVGGFPGNVGGGASPADQADCDLAELAVSRGAIAAGDIDRLFGYAAHRWGLAGSLGAGHPYKSAPP